MDEQMKILKAELEHIRTDIDILTDEFSKISNLIQEKVELLEATSDRLNKISGRF